MKAWDIVGYTYRAETLHPACLIERMIAAREASPAARDMATEEVLEQIASSSAIDRMDEKTFDSEDFPKVIFADGVEDGETCDRCGAPLID